jgi:hypothetical protein
LPAPVAGRQPLRRTAGILHIPNCKSVLTYCQGGDSFRICASAPSPKPALLSGPVSG